jgi:hypothetical protein
MPTSPPLRRTNAAHTAQATSLTVAPMTAIDAADQIGKTGRKQHGHDTRFDRRRIRMGLQIHTQGATRLPKRLRQICFGVITHDVSGAITGTHRLWTPVSKLSLDRYWWCC